VDHEAHVRFVDSHAEGGGGDDDLDLAAHERLLGRLAGFGQQAGVVGDHLTPEPLAQDFSHFLGAPASRRVDDSGARRFFEELDEAIHPLSLAAGLGDAIEEVFAGEAPNERLRLAEFELLNDVAADVGGGRRR
jgi:hypothetical protein